MEVGKNLLENAWAFVRSMERQVILVEQFGNLLFYIMDDFRPKGRDFFFNDVYGAKDITTIILNFQNHTIIQDKVVTEQQIRSLEKKNFSFAHDNFMWFKSVTDDKF